MNVTVRKNYHIAKYFYCCLLPLLFILAGCRDGDDHQQTKYHSLLERLEAETTSGLHASVNEEFAEGGITIQVEVEEPAVPTFVSDRMKEITQYPCTNCHTQSLARMKSSGSQTAPKAHWDVSLQHASETIMNCTTCHNEENINTLNLLTGIEVEFNHSYRVCAQCHSKQLKDWTGGAHGKRISGWQPPRVISNCVDCHNPHQPAWDVRWPAYTNELSR